MLKKSILLAGFTGVLTLLIFLAFGIAAKLEGKKKTREKIQTLPRPILFKTDSTVFQFPIGSPLLLIYFNSECEYCQYELAEIRRNIQSFTNVEVVLISCEKISIIKDASKNFDVTNLPRMHFTKIASNDLFQAFGSLSLPHIFIYDKDNKLVKEFKGETKAEAILKYIP